MLLKFGPEIWIVDGPVVTGAAGFRFPTRMTVVRLGNGDLVLWSPVACTAEDLVELQELGRVRHIVAPNALHHTFLGDWQLACPDARIHAAPGLRAKRPDIAFHADLDGTPDPSWREDLDLAAVRGNRITTEIVLFHRPSGTAVFTDLLQSFSPDWFTGWRAFVARLDLMVGSEPAVPRKFRVAFTDRQVARRSVTPILAWPTENVLMAHGTPVIGNGKAFLRRAFKWLTVPEEAPLTAPAASPPARGEPPDRPAPPA
jgi:hypothetical protein